MRTAPLADVKARLDGYLNGRADEGPLVITRNGKAVGVLLIPRDDADLERLLLARSPRFRALLQRSRRSIGQGEGLSEKTFWETVRCRSDEREQNGHKTPRRRRNTRPGK